MAAEVTNTSSPAQANAWSEASAGTSSPAAKHQAAAANLVPKPRPGLAFGPGSGSSAPPRSVSAPKAVNQKKTPGAPPEVTKALDNARSAKVAYQTAFDEFEKARRKADGEKGAPSESVLKNLDSLKAERHKAFEKLLREEAKLNAAVSRTIVKACGDKCEIGSAQKIAAELDKAVRADGSKLQAKGTPKDEVTDRQLAVRQAINSALVELAHNRLKSLIGSGANANSHKLVEEIASWVVTDEGYPAATTPFGHLKDIVDSLKSDSSIGAKNKERVTDLIRELVTECRNKRMMITPEQIKEIGLPASP